MFALHGGASLYGHNSFKGIFQRNFKHSRQAANWLQSSPIETEWGTQYLA